MDLFQELFLNHLKGKTSQAFDLKKEARISFLLKTTDLQDPFRFRARFLALKAAVALVDDEGEIRQDVLSFLISCLEEGTFLLGPQREGDALFYEHILSSLKLLSSEPKIGKALKRFSMPLCHKRAEEVIRETLFPYQVDRLKTHHVRKAAFCAWLTLLRQTTGSCFATSFAILIQKFYPLQFFEDLSDLLNTGQMKRVIAGKEYSAPFALNSGKGELIKKSPFWSRSLGIEVSLKEAGIFFTESVRKKIEEKQSQTAEQVLRETLLEHFELLEEDLVEEEDLWKMRMAPLLIQQSSFFYQEKSPRSKKIEEWKKSLRKAFLTFRSITDTSLLKTWEYSLASLADLKTEFARWNLFIALGLHPEQKGGIGDFLYQKISDLLFEQDQKIGKIERDLEDLMSPMRALELMYQNAGSQLQLSQIKSELASYQLSFESLSRERDFLFKKREALAKFFPDLIKQYDENLENHFQELFDPAVAQEDEVIDDSSAGFRLIYKNRRKDASLWSPIQSETEFVESLRDFFSGQEQDLHFPENLGKETVEEITTGIIQWIQTPDFIQSCFERVRSKGRRSPWDYVSGGTLQTLVAAYTNRKEPLTEKKCIPKSAEELFSFLQGIQSKGPLLMHSPTHAFVFYPEWMEEKLPSKMKPPILLEEQKEYLAEKMSDVLPIKEQALFLHLFRNSKRSAQFKEDLLSAFQDRKKESLVDSFLFKMTPLFQREEAQEKIHQILRLLQKEPKVSLTDEAYFGPFDLYRFVKMALLTSEKRVFFKEDLDAEIAKIMRALKIFPEVCFFADTNWSGWFFGFVRHPLTQELELWRVNRNGSDGFSMVDWKRWISPQNDQEWILLSNPGEYSFS